MHKRIEIVIRNPGFEGTENALGAYPLDFEDATALEAARSSLASQLGLRSPTGSYSVWAIVLRNENGDEVAFNPEFYVSHRIANASDWQLPFSLPSQGAMSPKREEER